ncbi:hypothetical protein DL96DRAFT_1463476 [Flagelloscypha sp. PMI_526]|nr:hypothetical protein DL96DRAFT_1463476 [Flagelloscypha sp. PMI_526]
MNLPPSMLSTIQSLQRDKDLFPSSSTHLFGNPEQASSTIDVLQRLVNTGEELNHSLTLYSLASSISNPKLSSLLRQQCQISNSLHLSEQSRDFILNTIRPKITVYGEDIPLDPSAIPGWCVARFERWGSSVGLEVFRDEESKPGRILLVFGGKSLVLDVEFVVEPTFTLDHIKTSFALNNDTHEGSEQWDAFLFRLFNSFVKEIQRPQFDANPVQVALLGLNVEEQLKRLVLLDKLASSSDGGGIQWFTETDSLSEKLLIVAVAEASEIAKSLDSSAVPLDIFLQRCHGLPLPYLSNSFLSFLVHVSPAAYLQLLHSSTDPSLSNASEKPSFDIPLQIISSKALQLTGCVFATLSLQNTPGRVSEVVMTGGPRPAFGVSSQEGLLDHMFPHSKKPSLPEDGDLGLLAARETENTWFLDFKQSDRQGLVMSQGRMHDIEVIVNPLNDSTLHVVSSLVGTKTGMASWVDMLINSSNSSATSYSTLYNSPSDAHPPLRIHLSPPNEPGFILERVPVQNMKQVWAILEVVREQCWLNNTLSNVNWSSGGLPVEASPDDIMDDVDEEELQAILSGVLRQIKPLHVPVTITIPPPPRPAQQTFDDLSSITPAPTPANRPKLVMTSPEKPPSNGMIEVVVTYDETKPKGVAVELSSGVASNASNLSADMMEEIVRRGGVLSLVGRLFGKASYSRT